MNNQTKLIKWLIQETNKGNIKWSSLPHKDYAYAKMYYCKCNEQQIYIWSCSNWNWSQFQLNDIIIDIKNRDLINSIEDRLRLDKENKLEEIASVALGTNTLEPSPPKPPSPWLRSRNLLGVAFVGSFALWTIFNNPGLCVVALGIGFLVCLIKTTIDKN